MVALRPPWSIADSQRSLAVLEAVVQLAEAPARTNEQHAHRLGRAVRDVANLRAGVAGPGVQQEACALIQGELVQCAAHEVLPSDVFFHG
jgi:hypothetical protein